MIFTNTIFNTTFFFPTIMYIWILPLQETEETRPNILPGYRHYQYNYIFGARTTYYFQDLIKLYHKDNHIHTQYIICTYHLN